MIELSFCPKSPRMVAHFDFDGDKKKVMENIRNLLIKSGIIQQLHQERYLWKGYIIKF